MYMLCDDYFLVSLDVIERIVAGTGLCVEKSEKNEILSFFTR